MAGVFSFRGSGEVYRSDRSDLASFGGKEVDTIGRLGRRSDDADAAFPGSIRAHWYYSARPTDPRPATMKRHIVVGSSDIGCLNIVTRSLVRRRVALVVFK